MSISVPFIDGMNYGYNGNIYFDANIMNSIFIDLPADEDYDPSLKQHVVTFSVDGIQRSSFWSSDKYKLYYHDYNNSNKYDNNNSNKYDNNNSNKYDKSDVVEYISVIFSGILITVIDQTESIIIYDAFKSTFIDDDFILEYDIDRMNKLEIHEINVVHISASKDIISNANINIDEYYKLNKNENPFYAFLMNYNNYLNNNSNNNYPNKNNNNNYPANNNNNYSIDNSNNYYNKNDTADDLANNDKYIYSDKDHMTAGNRMMMPSQHDLSTIARSMVIHNNRGIIMHQDIKGKFK